jgi:hypothetical protein
MLMVTLLTFSVVALNGCGSKATGGSSAGAATAPKSDKQYILIGRVNPMTGPLAGFGDGIQVIRSNRIHFRTKDLRTDI